MEVHKHLERLAMLLLQSLHQLHDCDDLGRQLLPVDDGWLIQVVQPIVVVARYSRAAVAQVHAVDIDHGHNVPAHILQARSRHKLDEALHHPGTDRLTRVLPRDRQSHSMDILTFPRKKCNPGHFKVQGR